MNIELTDSSNNRFRYLLCNKA